MTYLIKIGIAVTIGIIGAICFRRKGLRIFNKSKRRLS